MFSGWVHKFIWVVGFIVANELVEDDRATGKKGVVFKIDFEKAYDIVEWQFLDFFMDKKRVGDNGEDGCLVVFHRYPIQWGSMGIERKI